MKIRKDRILLQEIKESNDSIIITPVGEDTVVKALVVSCGELVNDIHKDDVILYEKQHTIPVKYNNKDYLIIRDYDVIAIL